MIGSNIKGQATMRKKLLLSLLAGAILSACSADKTTEAPPAIKKLDDASAYKAIYESDVPVLIEFCAENGEPSPAVTTIAAKHKGQFNLVRMSSEKSPETMQLFDVQFVPTLVFVSKKQCKHGKKLEGMTNEKDIELFIDQSMIQCRE